MLKETLTLSMEKFSGHLALQQRVLPHYRVPFFDALASACKSGMSLYAGEPRAIEHISTSQNLEIAKYTQAKNRHILKGSFYFCYQENLLNWLSKTNPDALILEANPRYLATPAAINWMKKRNRPVIGWGLGAPQRTGILAGVQEKNWMRFLNKFSALISYSQRGAENYAALGYPIEKIFVAPNAVAHKPIGGLLTRPVRQNYEKLIALYVGRIQERKKIDNLLRACAALPKKTQPKLWIVGEGPARNSLEKLAKEIYPSARFFGEKHGAELKMIWAEADLFVLPGTGGLAVQEAMSHALPVIVAQGDGTQDDLIRPENGWQIPPNDEKALREALKNALENQLHLRTMGAESYNIVAKEVNIEKMVEVFIKALRESVS
ncbi:MAG: glycosyltransferase family 4 protein [Anaerolineae bacterium]|jgi:glycosyltransferase involved in cell wall biosynthesis|nr:glycosyltransferase family 4 protein [Anaerolineae bacterium]